MVGWQDEVQGHGDIFHAMLPSIPRDGIFDKSPTSRAKVAKRCPGLELVASIAAIREYTCRQDRSL